MALRGESSSVVGPFFATIIGNLGHASDKWQRTPSSHELDNHAENHRELELGAVPGGAHDDGVGAVVPEVEDAECECCGMSQECTPAYIGAVRRRFSGHWVCGLCAEAVAEEAGKSGGGTEAALAAHMAVCRRFNGFGRTHPALFQADAVKGILRKLSGSGSPKSSCTSPREVSQGAEKAVAGCSPAA